MSDYAIVCQMRTLADVLMLDLHDHAAGYEILGQIRMTRPVWVRQVEEAMRVDGFAETDARLAGGTVVVTLEISGSTWVQAVQRWLAVESAYAGTPVFLLKVTIQGVTYTYRANRPDADVVEEDLLNNIQVIALSFPVQPNPTITGV